MNKGIEQATTNTTAESQAARDRRMIDQLLSYKKYWEPRWYLSQAFYEGMHFTYPKKDENGNWQRRNEVGKNKVIREIPKAKKQINSVRNLILKLRQRPVVYPDRNVVIQKNSTDTQAQDAEINGAENQGRYLDNLINEEMKFAKFKKKLVRYAAVYHVGFIQILNENGKKEFKVYDPFEISVYPTISNINEYPMLAKHISRNIDELINNDLYDQDAIKKVKETQKQSKYSASLYKNAYMQETYGKASDDNVLIDELYEIVKVDVDEAGNYISDMDVFIQENTSFDQSGNPINPKTHKVERCRIAAYVGTTKIRDDVTRLSKIPISMFCWGDEAYSTSLIEDMMPLNKAYDVFMSKLEHKAKKLDTGRIIMQEGEKAKIITSNDGEIVRYKRFKPEVMEEASVPNAFITAINMIEGDIKEQGVALTSASGIPQGIDAWRAIESLKEIDYSSVGQQNENLNECMVDIGEKLTEMIAYDLTSIDNVQIKDEQGNLMSQKFIGKRGADLMGNVPKDVTVIDPNRKLKWEVESDITWTEEGTRNIVLDLVKSNILPKEMALETLKFGNTRDIIAKLTQEATYGKSMIDAPDFQVLPIALKQQILQILSNGAPEGASVIPPIGQPQ